MNNKNKLNFIQEIIENDLKLGFKKKKLKFRFPPEPNGYLHIGHAKSIFLNFNLGKYYNVPVNLRFDDTDPNKNYKKFIKPIKEDIKWLGFNWKKECYSSDYFEKLYDFAIYLIKIGKAYVDDQSQKIINEQRKTPFIKGIKSIYRNRKIEENLFLFNEMKKGTFKEGYCVLRAKIDMNSPNMHLRDPIMYRIIKKSHFKTKNKWNIYPTYDWSHGQCDYIEKISHSICSNEFENHKPLYNWYIKEINNINKKKIIPKQYEFSRLNLTNTILSKRILNFLIEKKIIKGWDDPRILTIIGMRRRGYPSESIIDFCKLIGLNKRNNIIPFYLLENIVRKYLNKISIKVMVVINPLKLVIINYNYDKTELLYIKKNKNRIIPFCKYIYIEKKDFSLKKNFFRLKIGKKVRLKNAYIIKAISYKKNKKGNFTKVYCKYYPDTLSDNSFSNLNIVKKKLNKKNKVKSTIHWVSTKEYLPIKIRIFKKLFNKNILDINNKEEILKNINKNSLKIYSAYAEPFLKKAKFMYRFQFKRIGYFCLDKDSKIKEKKFIFNKIVSLKEKQK
ncbi:glutamine--tRNA ligase [Candidatus Shikimatogenerans silvanidophilus]|uniref:glutamine--tRNA ligase n=1 Tax=Candidatus Shikimatogenerans silvanidophilus TaxID=2782547 RepID=UPI001BA4F9A5|nr:glutamine--tRNA ligase [Candidatus Shikimatogenerans silvanidophilus]